METPHTETIVEKTVAFVKDVFGIHPAPDVEAQPEYHDTAPEVTVDRRAEVCLAQRTVVRRPCRVRPGALHAA